MTQLVTEVDRRVSFAPYDLVRVVLALVLLIAAGLKCHQLATSPAVGDGVLESRWLMMAAVEFELLFGLCLLGNVLPRVGHRALLLCFWCFAAISLYKAISGAASCGCFGRVEVNPWFTFTLDVTAIVALLRWSPLRDNHAVSRPSRELLPRTMCIVSAWLVLGTSAAIAMGTYQPTTLAGDGIILGSDDLVVLDPEKWVGQRLPLLDFVVDDPGQISSSQKPLRGRLTEGKWIVSFYRHDCPKCLEELPKYAELSRRAAANPDEPQLALIELPPFGELSEFTHLASEGCALRRLSSEKDWFMETPTQLTLRDGEVVNVAKSHPQ